MRNLEFCPKCGNKTLSFIKDKKLYCSDCHFTLYHNTAGAVAVVLKYKDEVLFTRRNQDPQKGKLDLTGGFVDAHESAEQTCQREIREELNFEIDSTKLIYKGSLPNLYTYKEITYNTLDLFFEYNLSEKPNFTIEQNELQEVIWVKQNKLKIEDLAFTSQQIFWKTYLTES